MPIYGGRKRPAPKIYTSRAYSQATVNKSSPKMEAAMRGRYARQVGGEGARFEDLPIYQQRRFARTQQLLKEKKYKEATPTQRDVIRRTEAEVRAETPRYARGENKIIPGILGGKIKPGAQTSRLPESARIEVPGLYASAGFKGKYAQLQTEIRQEARIPKEQQLSIGEGAFLALSPKFAKRYVKQYPEIYKGEQALRARAGIIPSAIPGPDIPSTEEFTRKREQRAWDYIGEKFRLTPAQQYLLRSTIKGQQRQTKALIGGGKVLAEGGLFGEKPPRILQTKGRYYQDPDVQLFGSLAFANLGVAIGSPIIASGAGLQALPEERQSFSRFLSKGTALSESAVQQDYSSYTKSRGDSVFHVRDIPSLYINVEQKRAKTLLGRIGQFTLPLIKETIAERPLATVVTAETAMIARPIFGRGLTGMIYDLSLTAAYPLTATYYAPPGKKIETVLGTSTVALALGGYGTIRNFGSNVRTTIGAGIARAGKAFPSIARTTKLRIYPAEKFVEPEILSGAKTFPTSRGTSLDLISEARRGQYSYSPRKKVGPYTRTVLKERETPVFDLESADFTKGLPKGYRVAGPYEYGIDQPVKGYKTGLDLWHATAGRLSGPIEAGGSASPGLYYSPSLSTYFLRLKSQDLTYEYKLWPGKASPIAYSTRFKDVSRIPGVEYEPGLGAGGSASRISGRQYGKTLRRLNQFLKTDVAQRSGEAYVTPQFELGKGEKEFIAAMGQTLYARGKETIFQKAVGATSYIDVRGTLVPFRATRLKPPKVTVVVRETSKASKAQEIITDIEAGLESRRYYETREISFPFGVSSRGGSSKRLIRYTRYASQDYERVFNTRREPTYSYARREVTQYTYPTYTPRIIRSPRPPSYPSYPPPSRTTTIPRTPSYRRTPPIIKTPPPTKIPKIEIDTKPKKEKYKKKKSQKRLFKYTPSLQAQLYNIKGTKPKTITGLEVRPINQVM